MKISLTELTARLCKNFFLTRINADFQDFKEKFIIYNLIIHVNPVNLCLIITFYTVWELCVKFL